MQSLMQIGTRYIQSYQDEEGTGLRKDSLPGRVRKAHKQLWQRAKYSKYPKECKDWRVGREDHTELEKFRKNMREIGRKWWE